jgi:hypothetical protein
MGLVVQAADTFQDAKVIGGVGQESNSVLELSRVQTRRRLHGLKDARCLVYETGQGS